MIDKISPIPAYYQIYQYITDKIKNAEWKAGSQIPTEKELEEFFEVSRMTLRRALDILKQEGVIVTQQGVGSFVAKSKITQSLTSFTGFSEDMLARGFKPGAQVMSLEFISAGPLMAEHFRIPLDTQLIKIKRLRYADEHPMAIEVAHLVASEFPNLQEEDLSQSLYNILKTRYGVVLKRARQQLQAGLPTKEEASILEIQLNEPVMEIRRQTYDQNDKPIEVVSSVYRGDLYVFDVELKTVR